MPHHLMSYVTSSYVICHIISFIKRDPQRRDSLSPPFILCGNFIFSFHFDSNLSYFLVFFIKCEPRPRDTLFPPFLLCDKIDTNRFEFMYLCIHVFMYLLCSKIGQSGLAISNLLFHIWSTVGFRLYLKNLCIYCAA